MLWQIRSPVSWAKSSVEILLAKLNTCLARLRHTWKLDKHLAGGHWHDQIENDFVAPIQWCIKQIQNGDLAAAATMITGFEKAKWNNRPKEHV